MARWVLAAIVCAALCLPGGAGAKTVKGGRAPLRVCAWVNYTPEWLLAGFTKETGQSVRVSFFSESDTLYRKVKGEGGAVLCDVITPPGELVELMVHEDMLLPLSAAGIPNLEKVDSWFTRLAYDKGNTRSVPLFWGILGIVIDKKVTPPELAARITGYADLWLPELRGKIMLPNDLRSVLSMLLLCLDYSVNEKDPGRLEEAMRKLEELVPAVVAYDSVDQEETLAKLHIAVGVTWVSESLARHNATGRFQVVVPKEGSPMWVDTLAIPKNSENPTAAAAFINFMLRPEILARLSQEAGYAVACKEAVALQKEAFRSNPGIYPPEALRHKLEVETMLPPPEAVKYQKKWGMLKSGL